MFAACWAHARRKVDECRSAFPNQVGKLESLIRMLYDVENQIRTLPEAERLERRGSLSRHALSLIDQYLNSDPMSTRYVLPKSNLGMAAAYNLVKLLSYLDRPACKRSKIRTNNHVEQCNRVLRYLEKVCYKWRRRRTIFRHILLQFSNWMKRKENGLEVAN